MIPINRPFTGAEELEEVRRVLESGYLTQGPKVVEFENQVKAIVGSKHAFAMSSATTALHLGLVTLNIGPGDEVLVSDFTFPATGNVILQQGATPICVDVLPDTYAMDAADLERRITPQTRAIMVVNPFGLSADYNKIVAIADAHKIPIVEDAACSLGAMYHGRASGSFGIVGCFSFHPRKCITTGEGGMIVTDDDALAARITLLRSHGGVRKEWYFSYEDAGFNYRLSDINAAVGVAQMRKLDWLLTSKRRLALQLKELLRDVPYLTLPVEPEGHLHTYQSFVTVTGDEIDRDRLIGLLRAAGVETTLGTYAMHAQPAYKKRSPVQQRDLPTSYRLFRQTLTLPLYPQMNDADLVVVAEQLHKCILQAKR